MTRPKVTRDPSPDHRCIYIAYQHDDGSIHIDECLVETESDSQVWLATSTPAINRVVRMRKDDVRCRYTRRSALQSLIDRCTSRCERLSEQIEETIEIAKQAEVLMEDSAYADHQ